MNEINYVDKGFLDTTGEPVERVPDYVRVSSSAVIFTDDNKILLQRRSDNKYWGLPGGGVEPGETPEMCIRREVYEETGLHVEVTCRVTTYTDMKDFTVMRYPNGDLVQYINFLFLCTRIDGRFRLSDETIDLRYFPREHFPTETMLSAPLRVKDTLDHIQRHRCVKVC